MVKESATEANNAVLKEYLVKEVQFLRPPVESIVHREKALDKFTNDAGRFWIDRSGALPGETSRQEVD